MEAREAVKAALEELEHLQQEYGWLEHDLEEDPDYAESRAGELITDFVMAGYRLWKAMGEPDHIRYPVHYEKGRSADGDRIIPSSTSYVGPISDIFSLILRG